MVNIVYYHLEPESRENYKDETIIVVGRLEGKVKDGCFTATQLSDSEVNERIKAVRRKFARKSVIYDPSVASWRDQTADLTFEDGYKLISVEV